MRTSAGWLERLSTAGVRPGDSVDERLQKALLVLASGLITVLAFAWTGTYVALGLPLAAAIPFTYQLATVATLLFFLRTGRFRILCFTHLTLMLVLPFLLQWVLGGFVESSAVSLWAFVAPLCAMMFLGARAAVPWFLGFVALLAVSAVVDDTLPSRADEIPGWVQTGFFVLNLAGVSATAFTLLQHFLRALVRERQRSERLLLNVLPEPVAERLKAADGVIADGAEDVTVLFADLVGFTELAGRLDADEVVSLLDEVFSAFDGLVAECGLEKIKTVGDGYLVAAGVPRPRADHAAAAAGLALAMNRALSSLPAARQHRLRVRIGLDSGPVVAGVIGRSRFSYDLWGDTVNTASRMETLAAPGEIRITDRTSALLDDTFELEEREPVEVKGKGPMSTCVVRGRRARRAGDGSEPDPDSVALDGSEAVRLDPV